MTHAASHVPEPPGSPFDGLPMDAGADIVAAGGALDPKLVMDAYRHGIFPWYDAGDPVLWWCPDPRAILPLDAAHLPRRLERTRRSGRFDVRWDTCFEDVLRACDENRADGSWIHADMRRCYLTLHECGHAHSCEVFDNDELVGGIYGVAFGGGFAAESKFHRARDASKIALVELVLRLRERGFVLLDVQFKTPHLERFGCIEISRDEYLARIAHAVKLDVAF